jgi:Zn-dependent peptidase ImmA (M78 family)
MKIFEVTDPIHRQLPNFVKFACDQLDINEHPTIDVVDRVPDTDGTTFGRYDNVKNVIYIVAKGRHPKDVFRTLAHELVHYQQGQQDRLNPMSGETGSDEENEANSVAGIIMRDYSEANPE